MRNVIEDKLEKQKILDRILTSEGFAKSEKFGDLLRYLFDANLEGKLLKETIIALEFFGRDSNFNPSEDPIVRVYIGNLRKRINHFYLTEGKDEKVRLTIPKGHYDVSFIENARDKYSFSLSPFQKFTYFSLILLLLFFIVSTIHLYVSRNKLTEQVEAIPKDNPVWFEFLNYEKPILVIFGDYFFMSEFRDDTIYRRYLRYTDINSIDDYNKYIISHPIPGAKLKPLNFTYLRPSLPASLLEILPILYQSGNEIILKLASETTWSDFDNSNVIYIGSYKTTYILNELLINNNIEFKTRPPELIIIDDDDNIYKSFVAEMPDQGQKQTDYGLIMKIKGTSNNAILLLLGFDELGILASAKKVSDPGFVSSLDKDLLEARIEETFYFKLVFEILGFRRTDLKSENRYFEIISENNN